MRTCGECKWFTPDSYEDGQESLAFVETGWCVEGDSEMTVRADDEACGYFEPKGGDDE